MMSNTEKKCDFCHSVLPKEHYLPINTKRGMEVYVCNNCSLIQSISTCSYESRPKPNMSCDADRASIKYTKDMVLGPHMKILEEYINFKKVEHLLDIGSNRGAFINYFRKLNETAEITAVESDPSLVESYASGPMVHAHGDRLENVHLENELYDFVHCVHTLEHFQSASEMISKIYKCTAKDGYVFFVVPNIFFIDDNIFEEIFIDPHTFHFHSGVLRAYLKLSGFKVIYQSDSNSPELIYILNKDDTQPISDAGSFSFNNTHTVEFMKKYCVMVEKNRNLLKKITQSINRFVDNEKIIVWGAGRIFDGIVRIGNLDVSRISKLVDAYLYKYMDEVHQIQICSPASIADEDKRSIIIVASREYESDIRKVANDLGFMRVLSFNDLLRGIN